MNNNRVLILIMDSFGIGYSNDAKEFGDFGANTFGHIAEKCYKGLANSKNRKGPLFLPNLEKKGIYHSAKKSRDPIIGYNYDKKIDITSAYGYAVETSRGKDTSSGHWEIAGSPVNFEWDYFKSENEQSCFPSDFIEKFILLSGLSQGIIDGGHASGTEIIAKFGDEHCSSLKPIIYTSADSVFQIACHEKCFGLEKLYEISNIARNLLDEMKLNIARVIARPFISDNIKGYVRTGNRHDYSVLPPTVTLLDKIKDAGRDVISIGKIADIFANQGITKQVKATGLKELFDKSMENFDSSNPGSLTFCNFVDFDSEYGHRRNFIGYAEALEYFDSRLIEVDEYLKDGDMVVITADHGCDPTALGSDHTREHIPFIYWGNNIKNGYIGRRETFADIGQTIADFLELNPLLHGETSLKLL